MISAKKFLQFVSKTQFRVAYFSNSENFSRPTARNIDFESTSFRPEKLAKRKQKINFYSSQEAYFSFIDIFASEKGPNSIQKLCVPDQTREFVGLYTDVERFLDSLYNSHIPDILARMDLSKAMQDQVLKEHSEEYKQLLKKFDSFIASGNITNLGSLGSLMILANVNDMKIWRAYIQLMIEKIPTMPNARELALSLESFLKCIHKFYYKGFEESSKSIFYFEESEVLGVVNKNKMVQLIDNVKIFINNQANSSNPDYAHVFQSIIHVSDILKKLLRVAHMNNMEFTNFLQSIKGFIEANLGAVPEHLARRVLQIVVFHTGLNDRNLAKQYYALQATNPNDTELMRNVFEVWKYYQTFDKQFLTEIIQPTLARLVKEEGFRKVAASMAYDILVIGIKDEEIWKDMLKVIETLSFDSMTLVQKKSLHIVYKLLRRGVPVKVDLSSHREMMEKLSKHCMGLNLNKNLFKTDISKIVKGEVNCCDSKAMDLILQAANAERAESYDMGERKVLPTLQENRIYEAIERNFRNWIKEDITITQQLSFCIYKIDIALEIPKYDLKIAIEFMGEVYKVEEGKVIGKKTLKKELLEKEGWVVVMLENKPFFALLRHETKANATKMADIVYQKILQRVQETRGVKLPRPQYESKWVTQKSAEKV